MERVTGIELALSAWEKSVQSGPSIWADLRNGLPMNDRESPVPPGLMAR